MPNCTKSNSTKTVDVVIDNQVETKVRFRETRKLKEGGEVGESKTEDSHGSPIGVRDIEMIYNIIIFNNNMFFILIINKYIKKFEKNIGERKEIFFHKKYES